MNINDLSGVVDGVIRTYKFTKTNIYGIGERMGYIPVLSIEVKEKDESITYRHFSINKNGDLWEDTISRRHKTQPEFKPIKEWMYYLYVFPQEMDARREISLKFIEFKNNYEDTSFALVDTLNIQFKENGYDRL